MSSLPPFRRSLPSDPDLDQQKKQAKDLLRAFEANEPDARKRVRAALPDKPLIALADAQFVLAREYGFDSWPALKRHIEDYRRDKRSPVERLHDAFGRCDARAVRQVLQSHPEFRARINDPAFAFNSPAIVAFADDDAMVEVLLDFGADPNRKSTWWAGGFHALHSASGPAADRLIEAGAIPDACAAANLDRVDLLARMIAENPDRVHERGGDGQTPLHFAKSCAAIDLLLDAGADIDARDVDHRSTAAEWMIAQERGAGRYDLARYLVEQGATADIFLAAALGLTDQVHAMLQATPHLLEGRTGRGVYGERPPSSFHIYFWTIGAGRTPLDAAAQFDQLDTVDAMLEFATALQRHLFASKRGDEALARSVLREHPGIIRSMKAEDHRAIADAAWGGDARAVALMVDLGFDPRTPGHDSGTALHCAAWQGYADIAAALLRHPDARDLIGIKDAHHANTPLGWCCHGSLNANTGRDYGEVARLLLEAGARPGLDTREASPAVQAIIAGWTGRL